MHTDFESLIVGPNDLILVTGASGFIGFRLVERLLDRGFRNIRCFARPSGKVGKLESLCEGRARDGVRAEVFQGNLLSREDCTSATKDAAVIFHLAAARGEKSTANAFLNSVVTTRNLLDAAREHGSLRRFVGISSFSVYSNQHKTRRRLLDESSPIESHPELRGEAYCFAKVKLDELVSEYGQKLGLPYVIVRPGYVYGPGNLGISGNRHVRPVSSPWRFQHDSPHVRRQLPGRHYVGRFEEGSRGQCVQRGG